MQVQTHLVDIGACTKAINWVGDRNFTQMWNECPYGAWLLWYIWKLRNKNFVSPELEQRAERALRQSSNLSPADRVRAVAPAASLTSAYGKFKKSLSSA